MCRAVTAEPCRALVVEDDHTISSLFQTILLRERFHVEAVRTGAQALEKIEAGDGYHLMVVDLMLPQVHGREVIEYLRTHRLERLKTVIVVSADNAAIHGDYPEAICKFLAKPFDIDEFVQHVHACRDDCDRTGVSG